MVGVAALALLVATSLSHGARLPPRGEGFFTPAAWRERGLRWGTRELVELIERAALRVKRERPGATLYVADLSRPGGGRTPWHRSHRSGRDVDLIYYATDEEGAAAPIPARMVRFDARGLAEAEDEIGRPVRLAFDTARNWALVRALVEDRQAAVTRIFVAEPLKRRLLDYARTAGEAEATIARADATLDQPGDSTPHDDHMHVRIAGPQLPPGRARDAGRRAQARGPRHASPHRSTRRR